METVEISDSDDDMEVIVKAPPKSSTKPSSSKGKTPVKRKAVDDFESDDYEDDDEKLARQLIDE